MALYEVTTDVLPQEVQVIPEQIVVPQLRFAAPSGTLAQGDIISGTFNVTDKNGNSKPLELDAFKITLKDWPTDPNQEILGVFYLNFTISNRAIPVITDSTSS